MIDRCGPVLTIYPNAYPKVRAVLDQTRRSVHLYKEISDGYFLTGPLDNPQIEGAADGAEPPLWLSLSESDAIAIRDALSALHETPKVEPMAVDERERYLRIIEQLAGTGEAA